MKMRRVKIVYGEKKISLFETERKVCRHNQRMSVIRYGIRHVGGEATVQMLSDMETHGLLTLIVQAAQKATGKMKQKRKKLHGIMRIVQTVQQSNPIRRMR